MSSWQNPQAIIGGIYYNKQDYEKTSKNAIKIHSFTEDVQRVVKPSKIKKAMSFIIRHWLVFD
jgi:hypothetical protein